MAKFEAPGFSIDTDQIESIDQHGDETYVRIKGLRVVIPHKIGIILEGYWNYSALSEEEQISFTVAAQSPTFHWSKLVKFTEDHTTLSYDGRLAFAKENDHIRMYHIDDAEED